MNDLIPLGFKESCVAKIESERSKEETQQKTNMINFNARPFAQGLALVFATTLHHKYTAGT